MDQKLPIGISDFKELIDGSYSYIDKTLLIQELIAKGDIVILIPRMRRFGKTVNLSMLRYFFEKRDQDTSYLFKSLNIWQDEKCRKLQGKFPVIFISLKDIKHASWQETLDTFRRIIADEFGRHRYLLEGAILAEEEKQDFLKILRKESEKTLLEQSLLLLTKWLHRFYKQEVILLIDEYDTPAHAAFVGGYYDELILFLRNWLSAGLKDNSFLEKGVLTGILRIAKESIFSGLNNISTFTLLNEGFQDKFGLTEPEVKRLLADYNLQNHWNSVRTWYNGYRIGSLEGIYNPWSVLNCIANKGALAPYWINTSDNALMKQLITQGAEDIKADLEELMKGNVIEQTIEEGLIFTDLPKKTKSVWSLLLFSGYLSLASTPVYGVPCKLRIPNAEVKEVYETVIKSWFEETLPTSYHKLLLQSLVQGDVETFSQIFQEFLLSSFSYFDVSAEEPEKIYHAFVLGLLLGLKDRYEVKSNRESGLGRYDVMLIPKNPQDLGIIFEFKKIGRFEKTDLETAVRSALNQIEEKKYDLELKQRGVKRILHLGLAFHNKEVAIRSKEVKV